jgi:hypothetical protein
MRKYTSTTACPTQTYASAHDASAWTTRVDTTAAFACNNRFQTTWLGRQAGKVCKQPLSTCTNALSQVLTNHGHHHCLSIYLM